MSAAARSRRQGRPRVTVFGSINIDLVAEVDALPAPGETVRAGALHTLAGGKGANQALAAARAGAAVRLVGAVGTDAFAEAALAECRASGMDLSAVRFVAGATGTALILVAAGGENVIAVAPGANGELGAEAADGLAFAPGDVLLAQLETPLAAVAAVIAAARAAGATTMLNLAPFDEAAMPLLEHADVLLVNEGEAASAAAAAGIADGAVEDRIAGLADRFDLAVVATLGAAGAIAAVGGRVLRVPALAVEAVDTVGAGDAFCGYLAAALAEGRPPDRAALCFAAAAASLACTRRGAQPAIPRREEVMAHL